MSNLINNMNSSSKSDGSEPAQVNNISFANDNPQSSENQLSLTKGSKNSDTKTFPSTLSYEKAGHISQESTHIKDSSHEGSSDCSDQSQEAECHESTLSMPRTADINSQTEQNPKSSHKHSLSSSASVVGDKAKPCTTPSLANNFNMSSRGNSNKRDSESTKELKDLPGSHPIEKEAFLEAYKAGNTDVNEHSERQDKKTGGIMNKIKTKLHLKKKKEKEKETNSASSTSSNSDSDIASSSDREVNDSYKDKPTPNTLVQHKKSFDSSSTSAAASKGIDSRGRKVGNNKSDELTEKSDKQNLKGDTSISETEGAIPCTNVTMAEDASISTSESATFKSAPASPSTLSKKQDKHTSGGFSFQESISNSHIENKSSTSEKEGDVLTNSPDISQVTSENSCAEKGGHSTNEVNNSNDSQKGNETEETTESAIDKYITPAITGTLSMCSAAYEKVYGGFAEKTEVDRQASDIAVPKPNVITGPSGTTYLGAPPSKVVEVAENMNSPSITVANKDLRNTEEKFSQKTDLPKPGKDSNSNPSNS